MINQFRKRYRKVDWKLLHNVDVDKIARDLDYHALQSNIMNIAFCDTQSQDFMDVDKDFIKLFRLGQYTIEYLLHCQEYLSHGTVELETKLREAIKFRNEVKEKLEQKQRELTEVKKESRKRKKLVAVYQGMVNSTGASGFHKCTYCDKAFVSTPFLESHLERRHNVITPRDPNNLGTLPADKLLIKCEEQQREICELKNKHMEMETELQNYQGSCDRALQMRDSALAQQQDLENSYNRWKEELLQRHKEELEEVKDIYLKQASEALEEKRVAELALVEAKKGIVSNLGALRDEKHESDELRQEQLEELEHKFEVKVTQLQQELERQSRKSRDTEDQYTRNLDEARSREENLRKELDDKIHSNSQLQNILCNLEKENGRLLQMQNQASDPRTLYSPKALAHMTQSSVDQGADIDVVQGVIATQSVDIIHDRPTVQNFSLKKYSPFDDKPFIKTHYEHSMEDLSAAKDRLTNDLAARLLSIAGVQEIDSLTNDEYQQYKNHIDLERMDKNTLSAIQKLSTEIDGISQPPSPLPTSLPPKSPSFKKSREALSRPNSSKRVKTTPPTTSPASSPILPRHDKSPRDDKSSRGQADTVSRLVSPSQPNMAHVMASSTPKLKSKSVDNVAPARSSPSHPQKQQYTDFDDSDEDDDISEILGIEDDSTNNKRNVMSPKQREINVGDLESDLSDEEDMSQSSSEVTSPPKIPTIRYESADPYPYDDESEDEKSAPSSPIERPPIETQVKRRAHKTYSRDMEEADSIFSFDGWSKMKNRNSMSADDAQQNIPMGHVAKMRDCVDMLQKQKRGKGVTGVGVSLLPDSRSQLPDECPVNAEEDDFTVSSLSERDLSPVGMTVDIKRANYRDDNI